MQDPSVRCDTEEASQHSRSVHLLTSRGRRNGWSGCDVSHECVHNIRAVAARASALHAVGVHRRRVLYCQHAAPRFVRLRPIPNHLPADKLQTGPSSRCMKWSYAMKYIAMAWVAYQRGFISSFTTAVYCRPPIANVSSFLRVYMCCSCLLLSTTCSVCSS